MKKIIFGLVALSSISAMANSPLTKFSGNNMSISEKDGCIATVEQTTGYPYHQSTSFKIELVGSLCSSLNKKDKVSEVVTQGLENGVRTAVEVSKIEKDYTTKSGLLVFSILKP